MDWKLEVVPIPVTDVNRAIRFYRDQVGFNLDHDTVAYEGVRFVQLTPPGSGCSIIFGDGIVDTPPGSSKGIILVVDDLDAARSQLIQNNVSVSTIQQQDETGVAEGRGGDWKSFVFFDDPDGNNWTVQERPAGN